MARAHVWRTGKIVFRRAGRPCPAGALPLPDVPRALIEARARRAYDGKTLLVPGVPEAETGEGALDALLAFAASLRRDAP